MKYKEIYNRVLPEKKRKEERHNLFGHYVGRPLSILLTMPLINTSITPTFVTKVSLVILLIGFSLVSFGMLLWIKLLGWFFFFLWNLLDGVDGNLARCKNQCSAMGDLWDTTAGYAAIVLTHFSTGISSFFDVNFYPLFDQYWLLIIGGASAIFSIFPRLVLQKKKSSGIESDSVKGLTDTANAGLIRKIVGNIASPTGLLQVFFLIAILTHTLHFLTIIYFVFNALTMMFSLWKLLKN